MSGKLQAVYYRAMSGEQPVAAFVDALTPTARAAIKNQISRLNLLDDEQPHLPFPHTSQVKGEIRELRCHAGRQHIRILYVRSGRLLILLHAFWKASERTPPQELATAERNWADFKARMDAPRRQRPRAAGRDAP